MGVVAEIAIIILWRNYCYKFGGEVKLQSEGGPIGQRPTMAASRLVMTDFFIKYDGILRRSGLKIFLMKVYVGRLPFNVVFYPRAAPEVPPKWIKQYELGRLDNKLTGTGRQTDS